MFSETQIWIWHLEISEVYCGREPLSHFAGRGKGVGEHTFEKRIPTHRNKDERERRGRGVDGGVRLNVKMCLPAFTGRGVVSPRPGPGQDCNRHLNH